MVAGFSLIRLGGASFAVKVAGVTFGLLSGVALARLLGAEQYGIYAFVISVTTVLAVPAQMGLPILVIRETASALANDKPGRMVAIWQWAQRVVLILSAALTGIFVAVLVWQGRVRWTNPVSDQVSSQFSFEGVRDASAAGAAPFIFALPLITLVALGMIRGAALRGLGHVIVGQLPEQLLRPLFLAVAVAVYWVLTGPATSTTAQTALILNVTAAVLAFLVGATILQRVRPFGVLPEQLGMVEQGFLLKSTMIFGLTTGMQAIISNTDIVMLGFLSESTDVGHYRIAGTGAGLVVFGLVSVNAVIMPRVVSLVNTGEREALQELVRQSIRLQLGAALAVGAVLVVFGRQMIILFYGVEFAPAYQYLVILVVANLLIAYFGPVDLLLNLSGFERDTLAGIATGALSNIALNFTLIPLYGPLGAAVATGTSILVYRGILCWRTYIRLGIFTAPLPHGRWR
ncbi:polysaccharide biosynthesis C-terminal domain-containing protein [Roseivivax sp. THAF30]|uniref:oligosaccharide flippase family protein n=1 Tax=Roseivivax sp. THAF30 TaxID=2587852 RepID=UPI0012681B74|nr:polysaccharide biosynthesis C-terminal domain-containing protein [Roseivivax sp. THAF30]QFT62748.1 Polysaccharide biosynthesis protein [Roseivivax sp. THAF30]